MTDKPKNYAKLLLNDDNRCILEFEGPGSVIFMDSIMAVLLSEAEHMLVCENCAASRNLTKNQIQDIISFTRNLLEMRGYIENPKDTKTESLH